MAWETRRNGRRYYYTKRKERGKVISEYAGNGYAGVLSEQLNAAVRRDAEIKRREWESIKDEQERLDQMVTDFAQITAAYSDAIMLLTGHHKHHREWRRKKRAGD